MFDNFDKKVTDALNNIATVSPSKNIGEAAIEIAMKRDKKVRMVKNIRFMRIIAISVCILTISLFGIMAFSEEIISTVSNITQNIFTLEKHGNSYKIIEKAALSNIDGMNLGGIPVDQFSKDELIKKLGFEPFIPEKISSYYKLSADVGVNLTGLSSDLNALDKDEVLKSIKDDDKFYNLRKYNAIRYLSVAFSPSGYFVQDEPLLILHMSKTINTQNNIEEESIEEISSFQYKDVKCKYIDDIRPDFQQTQIDSWLYDDNSKQPRGIIRLKHVVFELGNVQYSVSYLKPTDKISIAFSSFDYKAVKRFAENYIDKYLNIK